MTVALDLVGKTYTLKQDGRPHAGHLVIVAEPAGEGMAAVQCECGEERVLSTQLVEQLVDES